MQPLPHPADRLTTLPERRPPRVLTTHPPPTPLAANRPLLELEPVRGRDHQHLFVDHSDSITRPCDTNSAGARPHVTELSFAHPEPFDDDFDQLRRATRGLPPVCPEEWTLVVIIQRNGRRQVRGKCVCCGALAGGFVPHGLVENIESLPVERDHRDGTTCERCGTSEGVEEHHWAPKAIFGWDIANTWPTSFLCPGCHRLWHSTLERWRTS